MMPESFLAEAADPFALIRPVSDALYEPTAEGEDGGLSALCLPCADPWGAVVDIVAWAWDRPGHWWRRTGLVDRLVDPQWLLGDRIRLVETPADWLADRCESACILDWSIDVSTIFAGLEIVPSSPKLATRLKAAAEAWPPFLVL